MGLTALCLGLVLATPTPSKPAEPLVVYRNGLRSGWQDFGWTRRDVLAGQPARVDFVDHGGWIIGGHETKGRYQALLLWMRAPAGHGEFLAVRLAASGASFPAITITSKHTQSRKGEWREVRVPFDHLNPDDVAFDTITLSATRHVPTGWVYLDNIMLEPDGTEAPAVASASTGPTEIDETLDLEGMAGVVMEPPNMIGLAVHLGGGMPAGGGSAVYTAGFSARLSFADGYLGVGVRTSVSYHNLAVQAGDPVGAAIDARSEVVTLPMLGVLTLRLPLGPLAIYGHTGCGGAWIWASQESLGASRSADVVSWAVQGAVGAELPVGPGWLGLEAGYLILPPVELPGVLQQYNGGGLTMLLHYRLGA